MREQATNGRRAGVTFGVVLIFLALIGFTVTGSELLGELIGNNVRIAQGRAVPAAALVNFTIILALLGIWAGVLGARPTGEDRVPDGVVGGLVAGLVAGVLFAIFLLIVGSVDAAGTDMRNYLASLSHENVELITFKQGPIVGALLNLALLAGAGALGGLLRRLLKPRAGENRPGLWDRFVNRVKTLPAVEAVRENPRSRYVLWALLGIVLIVLPLLLDRYWNYNLGTIGIYVLLGLGLNIVVGLAGLLDLGYVAFFAIGSYTVALLTAPAPHDLQWSFWLALPIGVALAALAGVLLGIPVLRMRGDYLAIVTLGFGEIIRILSKSDLLTGFSGGPRGVRDIATPRLFGMALPEAGFMYLIILGCLLVIFVTSRLQTSRVGRAWIAMREDETVAQAMGINTLRYKLLAFAIGAAFAGLGGVLFASRNQFTGPEDHNLMVSINVLSLVIVGGMGSIPGVIMGALVLKGLPEILRELDVYRLLVFGALLVAMMIFRPEGIWPSRRRRLEIHHDDEIPDELEKLPDGEAAVALGGDV